MTEYQKIEYRIGKDGKIVETVLNASGTSCMEATAAIEQALGTVESRELLPSYNESEETLAVDLTQSLQQHEQH
ncbi:DUF2997 domain-containing protein [Phormidium sp. FACHB-592]|uniref:DUF2997 domain-containing protein n=1 Tax=Stenomitos frigidus AS-A4 TaxID=2933935 RepID=A0ABV0KTZ5_9CYAN|nr:DUF2997 domain-containing protein [Phormidium sp. FACHB-592]MBD2075542.1 DUF2997 domain-containing protein [Phormidium sp. FACHB-592]